MPKPYVRGHKTTFGRRVPTEIREQYATSSIHFHGHHSKVVSFNLHHNYGANIPRTDKIPQIVYKLHP